MALTPLHVQDVCHGQASQKNNYGWCSTPCKYLTSELVGKEYKSLCMKHAPAIMEKKKKEGRLHHNFSTLPDNCPGYKYMKYVAQGYNLP